MMVHPGQLTEQQSFVIEIGQNIKKERYQIKQYFSPTFSLNASFLFNIVSIH
jgi:hypothetical protein